MYVWVKLQVKIQPGYDTRLWAYRALVAGLSGSLMLAAFCGAACETLVALYGYINTTIPVWVDAVIQVSTSHLEYSLIDLHYFHMKNLGSYSITAASNQL